MVSNPAPVVAPQPDRTAERQHVLYVGGFEDSVKGADVLLSALPAILQAAPRARVTIAGPGDPPKEVGQLLSGLPGVRWIGWLDAAAKRQAFACAEVFVLPSGSEGMPNAMLEAMAYGHAVVASSVGGVPDV